MEFPVYARNGLTIAKGCGATVWDEQGRAFRDFYGGHAVAILGYGDTSLSAAICRQTSTLIFQTNAVDLDVRTEACRLIANISPPGLDAVFLVSSGAEANENALRLAFLRTGRQRVVALHGAFHGRTAAAAAVTDGSAKWYGFPRAPFDVDFVAPGDMESLDSALTDQVAAFIFEPIQGVAGAVKIDPEYLHRARSLCTDRGVVMIADEVQSGMGRSGYRFACEGIGLVPDLLTTAKGLGGGFPVGALVAPQPWADALSIGSFGTTFGGGPVACAAMIAVIEAIETTGFLENVRRLSTRLQHEAVGGAVQSVSGEGLLLGLHMDRPAKQVQALLRARGFLTGDAKNPSVVRLLPPLVIDDEDVDALLTALKELPL